MKFSRHNRSAATSGLTMSPVFMDDFLQRHIVKARNSLRLRLGFVLSGQVQSIAVLPVSGNEVYPNVSA